MTSETIPESASANEDTEGPTFIQECLRHAEELKLEGNEHFRARRWDDALCAYRTALEQLPKVEKEENETGQNPNVFNSGDDDDDDWPSRKDETDANTAKTEVLKTEPTELDIAVAKARAVLNANIGACHVKLNDHKEAVTACTQALKDDPQYIKALQRRAGSNEIINSWSSLTSAQEDYTTLLKILPPSSADYGAIQRSLHVLKPRLEAAQKRETADMMDKLKSLGNNILGNFGLSTDNFKFEPNGQGGYSMKFEQQPS